MTADLSSWQLSALAKVGSLWDGGGWGAFSGGLTAVDRCPLSALRFFLKASNVHIGHCESKGKTGMFEGKQLGMEIFGARNVAKKGWRTDRSRCLQLWICVCLSATPTIKLNLARTHLKTLPDDAHDNTPDFVGPWIFHASNACCIVNQLWSLDNNKTSFPPYYIKLWEWPKKDCVWHRRPAY